MLQLRDYQQDIATRASELLKNLKIAYLSMEVRTGKTLTALHSANLYGAKKVLFITKLKAIPSIKADYNLLQPDYKLDLINYESLHKVTSSYDLLIVDEAHSLGAFPKPSKRAKALKVLAKGNPILLLSGTPSPESYSQLYHQFWVSDANPFAEKTFYAWAKSYVEVVDKMINGFKVKDYKQARKDMVMAVLAKYFISYTQMEAGFEQRVQEEAIVVKMHEITRQTIKALRKDKVAYVDDNNLIVADTPAKMMTKLHQLSSGTVIDDNGNYIVTDTSKADYIAKRFKGQKIAIFYCFKSEKELLKEAFPDWTDSPEEFQLSTGKVFLGQFVSAREGVRLDTADALIFYNLQHSYLSYEQARNRLISKDRTKEAKLYFIFSDCGIERLIYKAVTSKKDFTYAYYKRNQGIL